MWYGKSQVDASDRRTVTFPDGSTLETTLLLPQSVRCVADSNGDGTANSSDLSVLIGSFGESVTPGTNGDLNGDGTVDSRDLSVLVGDFGCTSLPGPPTR